jgi:hypothetical protein
LNQIKSAKEESISAITKKSIVTIACLLSLLINLIIVLLIIYSNRGLDITDESYYILQSKDALKYLNTYATWGIFTKFIFALSNYNIQIFRIIGVIMLYGVAIFASLQFIIYFERKIERRLYFSCEKLLYVQFLSSGFLYYYLISYLRTPSYNWLLLFSTLAAFGVAMYFFNNPFNFKHSLLIEKNV